MDANDRLQQARRDAGYEDATEAARRFGWNENTYRSHENGMRGLKRNTAATYAKAFRVATGWLLTGDGEPVSSSVPVMGRIGAGAEIDAGVEQVPPEGYYDIESAVPLPKGSIAFEVVGDSMRPRYDQGDVIVCPKAGNRFAEIPDGAEAAVLAADGRRFLKEMWRTSAQNIYDLISVNASPIRGVEIVWAAEVLVTVRANRWRRVAAVERKKLIGESQRASAKR